VAPEPIGELLRTRGFRVGGVARPEHADEEFDVCDLTGRGVDEVWLLPGVVHKHLFPGPVVLTHGEAVAGEPAAVEVAEPGVAVPVGVLFQVLQVEEFQRDAGLPALGVEVGAIGEGAGRPESGRRAVQAGLQGIVGQGLDLGPVQAGMGRPAEDPGDGPQTDGQSGGHLPVATGQHPLLAEDLADLAHG